MVKVADPRSPLLTTVSVGRSAQLGIWPNMMMPLGDATFAGEARGPGVVYGTCRHDLSMRRGPASRARPAAVLIVTLGSRTCRADSGAGGRDKVLRGRTGRGHVTPSGTRSHMSGLVVRKSCCNNEEVLPDVEEMNTLSHCPPSHTAPAQALLPNRNSPSTHPQFD